MNQQSNRSKCNSILHIFGDWLFSAALTGSELSPEVDNFDNNQSSNDNASDSISGSFHSPSSSSASNNNNQTTTSTTTEANSSGLESYNSSSLRKDSTKSPGTSLGRRPSTISSSLQQHQQTNNPLIHHSNPTTPTATLSSTITSIPSDKLSLDFILKPDSYEVSQAEAIAILCRIFSSKSSTEDVSATYLSKFYLCLQHCLDSKQNNLQVKRQLLSSVLINSTTIFQKDLHGFNLHVPSFINAIEFIFECGDRDVQPPPPIQPPPRQHNRTGSVRSDTTANYQSTTTTTNNDLRRACISTLTNLSTLTFHFQDLVIRNCLNELSPTTTFGSLRPRILKLLFVALQTETDPTNMQILFAALSSTILEFATNSNRSNTGGFSRSNDSVRSRQKNSSSTTLANDSASNSLELSPTPSNNNNTIQDDTTSQSSFVFNSSSGFLLKCLHVTCHLLINIWKHDTQVSLAALELLTTIARVSTSINLNDSNSSYSKASKLNNNNNLVEMKNEYKQTTKWICDYICNQCSRPPPAHSRDMHSTIVAAYQCLSVWFNNHPYLLNDQNCLNTLMDVIELGVSGQKSKTLNNTTSSGPPTYTIINKEDKILKPSSMRVREAAESLLNVSIVRARSTDKLGLRITSSQDTVLDEQAIVELTGRFDEQLRARSSQTDEVRQNEIYKLFRYFSDGESMIFALYDSLNHDISLKDTVICLLRTPFGKHCWKIKFVYYTDKSREKIMTNKTLGLIKRPFQQVTPSFDQRIFSFSTGQNKSLYFNNKAKFFPETIEGIPTNDLDRLVLTLDDYYNYGNGEERLRNDLQKISKLFKHQISAEQKVLSECSIRVKRVDCEEPQPPTSDLDTARIIVAHLGLNRSPSSFSPIKYGQVDKMSNSFINDLKLLDREPVGICDTVNIFYVRRNKTSSKDIIESVRQRQNVSLSFFEWLLELGRPIVVKNHKRYNGWMSNCSFSPRSVDGSSGSDGPVSISSHDPQSLSRNQMLTSDHGGAIFDGERMMLYWSDMCQELSFIVPYKLDKIDQSVNIIICWLECPDDISEIPVESLLLPQTNYQTSVVPSSPFSTGGDCHVISALHDDSSNASATSSSSTVQTPTGRQTMPPFMNTKSTSSSTLPSRDYAKYFISTMKNGLYRVNLETSLSRSWLALPLVDGMTVSKEVLSELIRESILNLCRRRRLYADSYQPPHVRRRLRIQDICNNYKMSSKYDSAEFYNNLFKS